MSAAANRTWNPAESRTAGATDLVFGIGTTGLSVARYLMRQGSAARFADTRVAPPALGALTELDPQADIVLGELPVEMLRDISRIIVSPGIPDSHPLLHAARLAGIMAAKRTHGLIPLCHPLPITKVVIDINPEHALPGFLVQATVKVSGQTGVEMEALTAVSIACLTIYDMVKAAERGMRIEGIRLLEKSGGKSGTYRAEG